MFFASDNSGPVHPKVMEALAAANDGYVMAYGEDPVSNRARDRVREVFEAPAAGVWFVATGSAANALALACLSSPWDSIFCARASHIQEDECNAPEFFTGGAKLLLLGAEEDKFTAAELEAELARWPRSVHTPQNGPVSITNVTEKGTLYTLDQIRAITGVAHRAGLKVHLDGARLANACVALGVTVAEMSWKAGVDAVSFGGTKNGLMAVEAVVVFDPELARDFELRRKRAGHLFSKSRYLAAQMDAYLTDDLWRDLAGRANRSAQRLAAGLRDIGLARFPWAPEANMIFATLPSSAHSRAIEAGAVYGLWADGLGDDPDAHLLCRLVCDWSMTEDGVDRFIEAVAER